MSKYFYAGAVIVLVAVLGMWGYANRTDPFVCKDCNVVVIGVDTLRADRVHSLGYERETTPTIDALAARGFSFANSITPAGWTVPSYMSIFTGVYPSVHKVTNKFVTFTPEKKVISNLQQLSPGIETMGKMFKDAGYATGGFTGDAGVSAKFGYGKDFDVYTDEQTFGGFANSQKHALEWLDTLNGKKFFMFFHGYDLHGQFSDADGAHRGEFISPEYQGQYTGDPKEESVLREAQLVAPLELSAEDATYWSDLYDGKIRDADARLKDFLDQLQKRGLMEKTIIVLVSDHGEEFYEHKGFDHGHSLFDEQIHTPLVFVIPGVTGGKVIQGQVSPIDVAPTLLSLTGISPKDSVAEQLSGRKNLVAYMKDPSTPGYDVFSETDYRAFTHKRSVRTADGWKYVVTLESGKEELYNLTSDKGEQQNLIDINPEKASTLREKLRVHIKDDLHSDISTPIELGCLPVYQGECE